MKDTKNNLLLFVLLQNLTQTGNKIATITKEETDKEKLIQSLSNVLKTANKELETKQIDFSEISLQEAKMAKMFFDISTILSEFVIKELENLQADDLKKEYSIFINNLKDIEMWLDIYIDEITETDEISKNGLYIASQDALLQDWNSSEDKVWDTLTL